MVCIRIKQKLKRSMKFFRSGHSSKPDQGVRHGLSATVKSPRGSPGHVEGTPGAANACDEADSEGDRLPPLVSSSDDGPAQDSDSSAGSSSDSEVDTATELVALTSSNTESLGHETAATAAEKFVKGKCRLHQDHIAPKAFTSEEHYALVHKPVSIK